ncbi:MAG TPA: type II toxin-antitoxin system RelE/ParE family toxin [Sphingomicrobium sp.]|nr:type II toxin-antitoxin system RelE/ParE family toxin [Sphingomicrobium sp.]
MTIRVLSSIKDKLSSWRKLTFSTVGSDRRSSQASNGNFGDVKPAGSGVSEMRIDYGPGYRVYFFRRGKALVILLCGGDKKTQDADIAKAKRLKDEIEQSGEANAV